MAVVKILRSTTPGHVPSSLLSGQVSINEADGIFFWLDGNDGVTIRSFNFRNPVAPTKESSDDSTAVATTAFVQAASAAILGPGSGLDSIYGIAAAINNDPNYHATIANILAACLRFDIPQTLNATQLAQIAANIGSGNFLRFDIAQALTAPQLVQVLANLGNVGNAIRFDIAQSLTGAQQAQAQANIAIPSPWSTGDLKLTYQTAQTGWLIMNDGSIGDASSSATSLATSATSALFTLLYGVCGDADVPIQTSSGGGTTRSVQGSAAAAYAAHCRLVLPKALGRALACAGGGAGLSFRSLGSHLGAETITQSAAQMPPHDHLGGHRFYTPDADNGIPAVTYLGDAPLVFGFVSENIEGGGQPMNIMDPLTYVNVLVKL